MQPALLPGMPGLEESAGAEARWLKVVGRLADNASVERAEAAARVARQVFLTEKAARLGANTPEVARDRTESFRLVAGAAGDGAVRAQFARPLTFLAVITALVLVVACTNFTNLMFARAEARRREFLIRLALGGGQWRLIRESAAECLALAAIAGALALLFAGWATSMAMSLVSALEPLEFAIGLNARVMAFAGACVIAAAAFGLWPSMRLVRSTVISSVHHRTGTAGARPVANRIMLIGQLVVCAILMFGAGLLLRTVINLRTQDLGYERNVLLIPIAAERPGRPPEAAPALVEHLRQQIAAIPGVQAAGVFGSALLDYRAYWVDGSERLRTDRGEAAAGVKWTFAFAGPGFFDAVGMRAVQGRPLSEAGHEGEVAINESLARALFGDADPIGRQFAMNPKAPMLTIVGVMKDAQQISPRDRGVGVAYLPIRRYGRVTLAVRLASPVARAGRLGAAAGADDCRGRPVRADDDDLAGARAVDRARTLDERDRAVPGGARRRDRVRRHLCLDGLRRYAPPARVRRPAGAGRDRGPTRRDGAARRRGDRRSGARHRGSSGACHQPSPGFAALRCRCARSLDALFGRGPAVRRGNGRGVQACAARVAHRSDGAPAPRVTFALPLPGGLYPLNQQRLSGGASRLAALLLPHILPVCSVVAPCQPGAALRNPLLIQRNRPLVALTCQVAMRRMVTPTVLSSPPHVHLAEGKRLCGHHVSAP